MIHLIILKGKTTFFNYIPVIKNINEIKQVEYV